MKNEYKKLEQIGQGSFATVWLALDPQNRKVVLKEYKSESLAEARREFLFLKALRSDNIVKPLEFQEDPLLLVQEFVEGKSLVPTSLKTAEQKFAFLTKLASLLSHLHSAGICHNDLKPENILLRDDEPLLIDLGLATPNRFYDGIFRGTPAFAAPEKISRNLNTFGTDIFAFALLAVFVLDHHNPAETMAFADYKMLLASPADWHNYLQQNVSDELLKTALSLAPDRRPSMAQLALYFSGKVGISVAETKPDLIGQYIFQCQQDAVKKLLETRKIICSRSDEPEKIGEQTMLWLESAGNETLLLKESDFIWQPQLFYQQIGRQIDSESDLIEYFANNKIQLVLWRDLSENETSVFDQLADLASSYVINISSKSSLGSINFTELEKMSREFDLNLVGIPRDFSAKPNLTRLQLLRANGVSFQQKVPQEIIGLLAAILLPTPALLLENIYPNAADLLPALVSHPSILIKNDGLLYVGDIFKKQPAKQLLERFNKSAENLELFSLATRSALLLKQETSALHSLEKYINLLISQEYFASAYEVLQVFSREIQLPLPLQKRQAFLLRKNGFPLQALQKYEALEIEENSLEFATIASDRAVILQELNRLNDARQIYESVLPIFEKTENWKSFLRTLNNIGVIDVQSSHFHEAEKTFLQLLEKAKSFDDKQFITMAHLNLADVYLRRGEWRKSLYQAQTAAEMGRKFNRKMIEVWAQIYGIQAQWALGSSPNLAQAISQILADEKLREQTQLLENFAINMLPIMLDLQCEKCDEIFSLLNKSHSDSDEKNMALFWFYSEQYNFLQAAVSAQKITDKLLHNIARAYLGGDSKLLVSLLRDLGLKNDCFRYLQTAVMVLQHPYFEKDKELQSEIANYASLHPFHPLTIQKKQSENQPEMQHLQVLWKIISLIHSNESFDTTMQSILTGVIRIAELERAVYFQFDNGEMMPRIGMNRDLNPLDPENIRISNTILQETIKLGQIRFFEGLQEETPFDIHSSIFGLGLRTAVCYPIIVNNEIRGVIYADATAAKDFSEQEQNLLETLFVQSRAALEKTEKIEILLRERQQILESTVNSFPEIIGSSMPMQKIFALMKTVGSHNVNVLITGPTGSGKELIARALHREYNLKAPFIAVNCAAIPENLLESELFGYAKGAFTGAVKDTKGKIEAANNGTLFLDEIGEMPAALQAKLLRVLQDRLITPLGSTREIPVSFRIITATNQNLKELIASGRFREDLYFRLNVVEIDLPSLSERKDDILPLAEFFLQKFNGKFGKNLKQISNRSARTLLQNEWRGNVRELENTMEKAVLLSAGEELDTDALQIDSDELNLAVHDQLPVEWEKYRQYRRRIIHQLDKRYTEQLLEKTDGNINKASVVGNIPRPQIYRILKEL